MAEKKYIDVEKLKSFIDCGHLRQPTEICFSELDVCNMIDKQPAADVAEVVRCKDCKYSDNWPYGLCYLHTEAYANERGYKGEAVCVELDDYCSYGKRKDGEENAEK